MDDYILDIDLKNKSAVILLPYFIVTCDDKSKIGNMVQGLSEISEKLVVSVEQNKIHVKIKYDFGPLFNDEVWKLNDSLNNSMSHFVGDSYNGYFDNEIKNLIFEKIKEKYLHPVLKTLQKSALKFQEEYNQ